MKRINALLFFGLLGCTLFAQETPRLLQVHISPNFSDFLTTEVPFVDFVSDRRLSDVQFQSLVEPVGNGSVRYRYLFLGYGNFEGQNDTVTWHTDPGENPGSIREKGLQAFKRGLLPYLLQTPISESIEYSFGPVYNHANTPDPWNRWTFNPGLSFNSNGEFFKDNNPLTGNIDKRTGGLNLSTALSIWRIGELWRLQGEAIYRYAGYWKKSQDGVGDASTKQDLSYFKLGGAYSLSDRWSVGLLLSRYNFRNLGSSTTFNNKPRNGLALGLEYSFLPYRDYFRKRLLLGYNWQTDVSDGEKVDLVQKLLKGHSLYGIFAKTARWGYFSNYLSCQLETVPNQWTRYSFRNELDLAFNLGKNIFLTLALNASWGNQNYSLVQLGGVPVVQSRNVRSGGYTGTLGVDYYFGSGYRNIINPRLVGI